MDSIGRRKPYTVVSANNNGYGSIHVGNSRRDERHLNYRPIPLRLPFLSICAVLFAICVVLIELLLRNAAAYIPPPPITTSTSISLSLGPRTISTVPPTRNQIRDLPATYCANAAALPSQIAANRQSSDSLCSQFTASYKGHTANMSYSMQTAVAQWLNTFNAVTAEYWDLRVTSLECTPSADRGPASWTMVTADVGCATSVTPLVAPCTGFGSMYITGFQLTSTILPVCGVSTSYLLDQTSQLRTTSVQLLTTLVSSMTVNNELTPTTQPRSTNPPAQTTVPDTGTVTASKVLVPTSSQRSSYMMTSQVLDPTASQPRTTSPSANSSPQSDIGSGLGLTTVTLPVSNTPISSIAATQTPPSSSKSPPSSVGSIAQGTTIIGIQTEASRTLVTEVVGSRTTVVDNASTQGSSSQTIITQVVGSNTVITTIPALNAIQSSTVVTQVINGNTVMTTVLAANAIQSSTSITQVVSGSTVVTIVPVLSFATSMTVVTAIVSGNTVLTTVPVVSSANNNFPMTTVVSGQTIVTTIPKTAVTAIISGQTVVTDILNTATGVSKILITELVSGKTVTTEVGVMESTTGRATDKALAESSGISTYTTTTQYISVMTTIGKDGKPTSFSAVVVQTIIATSTGPSRTNSTASASVTRPPQPTLTLAAADEVVNGTFTTLSYFAAQYLPALVAVLIKALWEMVFAAVKLVEPFERMNRPEGAGAQYSLFAQYLSTSLSLDVVRSIGHGNFIPLATAFALVLIQVGTPLSTAAMSIRASDICIIDGIQRPCAPIWIVNTTLLRVVQAALGACILIAVLLAILMRRFRSGVSCDPSSVGALAGLMNHEQLNRDIQRINRDTDYNLFEEALERHQFWLTYIKAEDGVSKYGVMGSKESSSTSYAAFRNRTAYSYHQVANPDLETTVPEEDPSFDAQSSFSHHSNSYTRTSILTRMRDALITDTLGVLVIATLFALIVAFYLDPRDDSFNAFFNSNSLASRFLLVSLATISALQLSHIERVIRITEPFRRLAANFGKETFVPHETTLLVSRSGTPYSNIPQNFSLLVSHEFHGGRMSFQTLVSLTAVLADLNIIAVSGIAFSDGQTIAVYQGSCISGIALSSAIFLMWLFIFIWWRNDKTVKVVRATKGAGTIGGIMRYLAGGGKDVVDEVARVAEDWKMRDDTGRIDGRGRDSGLKPCFGRFMGDDGKDRWCVGFLRTESEEKRTVWG